MAIDAPAAKAYYTDPSDCVPSCGSIRRSDLDGANEELLVAEDTPGVIDVSRERDRVCWADDHDKTISCADLDGLGTQVIVTGPRVKGLAIEPSAGKIYWTDGDTNSILRADLDGSSTEVLAGPGFGTPHGIDVDSSAQVMYWTDSAAGTVLRASLDGSNVETIVTGQITPTAIAVAPAEGGPGGDAIPTVSELGVAILALLLVAMGTALFGRP